MAKYDPLRDRLGGSASRVQMTFAEISDLVGGLPTTAYAREQWWENNDYRHVQAAAWLSVGMRVAHVDLNAGRVVFAKG